MLAMVGRDARLAGRRTRDRAACAGAHGRNIFARRLCLRSRRRQLCLSGRKDAAQAPSSVLFASHSRDEGKRDSLSRQQARLRRLCVEAAMLSKHSGAQSAAFHPRNRSRQSPRHRQDGAYVVSRRERKKVEMLFAHLKRSLRLDRLRLRGPMAPAASSFWPPRPKICGSSPS